MDRDFCPRCAIKHLGQAAILIKKLLLRKRRNPILHSRSVRRALKYLGQAAILVKESAMGYPLHVYYALAHMAEASDELVAMMPDEANAIRDERLKLEDSLKTGVPYMPDFDRLMLLVAEGAMLEETLTSEGDTQ